MTAQALYRKWRPQTFDEVVGQEHVVRTLRNALVSGRVHHAYLFAGPRGTGKTTTARLLAKAVNCLAPEEDRPCNKCEICVAINEGRLLDLIEIDAASNTGVDDVRELRERVGFRPNEARYKVYVIDEVHMLSNAAFNALLKTLEEPPEHAIFVLATTEPHKILPTVLSRCQRFDFHRISLSKMVDRLAWMAEQEGIDVERAALELIARQATGSMRDAESLLDQLASYNSGGITVEEMRSALGIGADETVMQITQAMVDGDVAAGLEAINEAVDEGTDPRQFARQMVEHLRALLLLRLESGVVPPHIPDGLIPALSKQAEAFSRRQLAQGIRLFNEAAREAKGGWQPQLPLEMAFIEALLSSGPTREANEPSPASGVTQSADQGAGRAGARHRTADCQERDSTVSGGEVAEGNARTSAAGRGDGEESGSGEEAGAPDVVRDATAAYEVPRKDDRPLSAEQVRERWSDLLDALRPQDLSLEALMRSCEPVDVQEDAVILSFTHQFHRSKVEDEKKRRIVEDALSSVFGEQLHVRCVVGRREEARAVESAAEQGGDAEEGTDEEGSSDPLIRLALDELGAEVVTDEG